MTQVLPESLADALRQAAVATADAIQRSNARCQVSLTPKCNAAAMRPSECIRICGSRWENKTRGIQPADSSHDMLVFLLQVEILLTEFWDPISGPIFPNRGDQERFWKMTRRFLEEFSTAMNMLPAADGSGGINAVYPDSGVAAMLSHQWKGTGPEEAGGALPFRIMSLNDRIPVSPEDGAIVVACPDPQVMHVTAALQPSSFPCPSHPPGPTPSLRLSPAPASPSPPSPPYLPEPLALLCTCRVLRSACVWSGWSGSRMRRQAARRGPWCCSIRG